MAFDKPVRVARFGGTSTTEAGNSAEPPSGKKDLGWVLNEEPASSFYNWLHYRAYKWFRWLDERMDDLTTKVNLRIHPPPVEATSDDGGDLELAAADSGTDADKNGGDAVVSGGDATGSGHSNVIIKAALEGASGVAARVAEEFIRADGDILAGPTTRGAVIASKTVLISTPAGSDGAALIAQSTAGTGHAVEATADATDPVSSAIQITPQDKDPSSPANGNVYVNSVSDHIAQYSALLGRFQNLDPIVHTTVADSLPKTDASGAEAVFQKAGPLDIKYTIKGGTLRAGSVIRIKATGLLDHAGGGAADIRIRFRIGGLGGVEVAGQVFAINFSADSPWRMVTDIIVRSIGATGKIQPNGETGVYSTGQTKSFSNVTVGSGVPQTIDTTGDLDVVVTAQWATTGNGDQVEMHGLIVEVQ